MKWASANATKVERMGRMAYGQILSAMIMGNQQPSSEQGKVQRLSHKGVPSIRKHGAYMTPEMIEKVLLTPDMVIGLATKLKEEQERNRNLQVANDDLHATNDALTEETQTWDAKSVINALVRKYASVCCGCNFAMAWNTYYKHLAYKGHIELKKRRAKGKKGITLIDLLDESEYPTAIKIAVALCESGKVDTGKVINEVNLSAANSSNSVIHHNFCTVESGISQ